MWGPSTVPLAWMPCGGLRAVGVVGGICVQAPPPLRLPALWEGSWGSLATCRGRRCGCMRRVWCLCGACRGARCCPSSVPLVPPSPLLCCGVVPAVCLLCPLPCARPLLGCWLPPVSFVVSSLYNLSSTLRWPALFPGMHLFPCLRPGVCLGLSPCLRGVCCVLCAVSWASWLLCACSAWCVVCVVWVWVCAHVCNTVLVAFFVAPKSRRCRCTPLGLMCASMTYVIWSLRCGLFVFCDAQE